MGTAKLEQLAVQRLAAHGDRFLSAFDDMSSEDGDATVLRPAQQQENVRNSSEEASSSTDMGSDDTSDATSDSGLEQTADAPQVFEFDSKTVRPQGRLSSRPQPGASSGSRGGSRSGGKSGSTAAAAAADSDTLSTWTGSRSELLSLQRQVQTYGSAALDKKAKKQFEATQLAKLGARAEKAPRMPASVGKGMKRKHTARAERAQEEAVEAGHLSRQAIAKTRRLQKAASAPNRDTGLGEHGGAFRGGVLRIAGGPPGGKLRAKAKRQLRG